MATREEFAAKLAELEVALPAAQDELQARYDREVKEVWDVARAALPPSKKRKKKGAEEEDPLSSVTKMELSMPTYERLKPLADALMERRKALEEELRVLAESVKPVAGELSLTFDEVSESAYHTQGFGAGKYAQMAAEMRADTARVAGIPVEVLEEAREYPGSTRVTDSYGRSANKTYRVNRVVVHVMEELDFKILKFSPRPSVRESVRLCWARGVNPRVYNPWLPFGYEEKVGLDYFGRDLLDPKRGQPKVPSVEGQ